MHADENIINMSHHCFQNPEFKPDSELKGLWNSSINKMFPLFPMISDLGADSWTVLVILLKSERQPPELKTAAGAVTAAWVGPH